MTQNTETDLVRFSRAGDAFHYRWAARRCLRMLPHNSNLRSVVIEGSEERKAAGEYVIDVAEYAAMPKSNKEQVTYYQLKHSTKRALQPFKLSDLKDTVEGFAKRYKNFASGNLPKKVDSTKFVILTNRVISDTFKDAVSLLKSGDNAPKRVQNTLTKYTGLKIRELKQFCAQLELCDGEGDYVAQRHQLHCEIAGLLADTVDTDQIESIIALVAGRALPNSDGAIVKEDILKRFGVTSSQELFPAPAAFEKIQNLVNREQHADILTKIITSQSPTIIKASGGVGKSVFTLQLANSLPPGSLAITYDCFGAGKYRNRSTTRHMHRHALVQIINEIAAHGFCLPLIPKSTDQDDALMRSFMSRLQTASEHIGKIAENAVLAVFIDAADNAEMAAEEFSESCFANQLLRESVPDSCRIVALCRPERVDLLKPSSTVQQIILEPFSEQETELHLKNSFAQSTKHDCLEFHRLTGGNPRVQANVLAKDVKQVTDALIKLGPGATVDEQIEAQLTAAINELKDSLPSNASDNIDTICVGLANLPPFIPLKVLAVSAGVKIEAIQSFISDLGRPLWLTDNAVQFRDEPTETWFRKQFVATTKQISLFVERLKPLAADYPYISESLPSLLLQAGQYEELIHLALSDDCLPTHSPIDARNIRIYRLQFAFKAAMKRQRQADAIKLALLAGEEVAGNDRQLKLLNDNIDLIAPLQSPERVQELAYRRLLSGGWDGSENVYSASLLSSVSEFKGEARGYLRNAKSWLNLYFEARKESNESRFNESLQDEDIVELTYTDLNLFGPKICVSNLLRWTPKEVGFHITRLLVRKLVDAANFELINDIALAAQHSQHVILALTDELLTVGRYPPKFALESCLAMLINKRTRLVADKTPWDNNAQKNAFVSFAEACFKLGLPTGKIQRFARHYFEINATEYLASDTNVSQRKSFLRGITLLALLQNKAMPTIAELIDQTFNKKTKEPDHHRNKSDFKEVIGALLPWYIFRAELLSGRTESFDADYKEVKALSAKASSNRWKEYDPLPFQISEVKFEVLKLAKHICSEKVASYLDELTGDKSKWQYFARVAALRSAYRIPHLCDQVERMEQDCYEQIESQSEEGPEEKAKDYILLARAVMSTCVKDAAAYFDLAIEAVSKFGEELFYRWEALVALAKRCKNSKSQTAELPYRFIRCAELVGDNFAREKHWDRNEAITVCVDLCPKSGIAALSRWRERDIGWFDRQLPALANKLLSTTSIDSAALWALSRFSWEYGKTDFAIDCINRCPPPVAQSILDIVVNDLRVKNTPAPNFKKLAAAVSKNNIVSNTLDEAAQFYREEKTVNVRANEAQHPDILPKNSQKADDVKEGIDWDKLFKGLNFETIEGIAKAATIFDNMPYPRCPATFWQQVCNRVPASKVIDFLYALSNAESIDLYDIRQVIGKLPNQWLNKIGVKKAWPRVLENIGKNHAVSLAEFWRRKDFLQCFDFLENAEAILSKGIKIGLAQSGDLASESTFWGYVQFAADSITPEEATTLLEFGLARFELHMDENVADGPWAEWLIPPENLEDTFTGFIWSALGSPRAEMRWQAAHCVRTLAAMDCQLELDSIIGWMTKEDIGALGCSKYPFYILHARQYLLIALAHVATDTPKILKKHSTIFEKFALRGANHILIQKYARDIALAIENDSPGTYSQTTIDWLEKTGVSQLPVIDLRTQEYQARTSWHIAGDIDTGTEFLFGLDFPDYWLAPLGKVFGINVDEVKDLARSVLVKDWKIDVVDRRVKEPRSNLWRSRSFHQETWQRHSDYPKTDDYRFYLSYHAMLSVAAKLVMTMPIVQRHDYDDDNWNDWLSKHLLTRQDGRWLADRRDHMPLLRRPWVYEKPNTSHYHQEKDNWRWMISATDFLNGLLHDYDGTPWLNLWGDWNEIDDDRIESYHVNSALVSPETAQSLLLSLQSCANPYDFKLPEYDEEQFEINAPPFQLTGWIVDNSCSSRIDKFDTSAGGIQFPPLEIADNIAQSLGLEADLDRRHWFAQGQASPIITSELWSSHDVGDEDDTALYGRRIRASLSTLKQLCSIMSTEIIFEVQVSREYKNRSYSRDDDDVGYFPVNSKIFILSADGKLRDYRETYQLGEADS